MQPLSWGGLIFLFYLIAGLLSGIYWDGPGWVRKLSDDPDKYSLINEIDNYFPFLHHILLHQQVMAYSLCHSRRMWRFIEFVKNLKQKWILSALLYFYGLQGR